MRGLKKKRRIQVIAVAAVALAVATGLVGYAMRDGINFFRSPSQVLAEPPEATEYFRLGGMVEEGSLTPIDGLQFSFVVRDNENEVQVIYVGTELRPDLFGEGQGAIAEGTYVDGVFRAQKILAKHDEDYMPREITDVMNEQNADIEGQTAPNGAPATN